MEIQTKFNIGDRVVAICNARYPVVIPCPRCNGRGRLDVVVGGDSVPCDKCHGRREQTDYPPTYWKVTHRSGVGKISYERTAAAYTWDHDNDRPLASDEIKERYMLESTGVGSGSVWSAEDLFATDEEAQAECDRRNAGLAVGGPTKE